MKALTKTQIRAFHFDNNKTIDIKSHKMDQRIVRGWIDEARVYFLETRCALGFLVESTTYTSLTTLIKGV